jgi:RHS repeat-associated protein
MGGVTTNYLVDTLNPTGYAQVLDELQSSAVTRSYTWGQQLIGETQAINGTSTTSYYGFDGHGSVRFLTNATGTVTDSYDYDAFGNLINSTGSTPNNYLFAGEQYDPYLNLYYNRARYLDVRRGRFWGMDTSEGNAFDPSSLHKYLYAFANPVNVFDRSGHDGELAEEVSTLPAGTTIDAAEAQSGALAMRVLATLRNLGVTATVIGTGTALVPEFQNLANAFEENEGIVVQVEDELFAIRYMGSAAAQNGRWWGTQMFNSVQEAISSLQLDPSRNNASEIALGVIPQNAQLLMGYCADLGGGTAGGAFQIYNYANVLIESVILRLP